MSEPTRYQLAKARTPGKRWNPHLGANRNRVGKRRGKRYWSRRDHKIAISEREFVVVPRAHGNGAAVVLVERTI